MSSINQVIDQLHAHYPNCRVDQVNHNTLHLYGSRGQAPVRLKVFESRDHLLAQGTVPASLHPHLQYVGYWRFTQQAFANAQVDFRVLVPANTAVAGHYFLVLPNAPLRTVLDMTAGGERFYWDITASGKSIASRPLTTTQRVMLASGHELPQPELDLTNYVNNWQQLGCSF